MNTRYISLCADCVSFVHRRSKGVSHFHFLLFLLRCALTLGIGSLQEVTLVQIPRMLRQAISFTALVVCWEVGGWLRGGVRVVPRRLGGGAIRPSY